MSTMPLAQSLRRRGASLGTLTAFIMIAPILSPHTIFLTAILVSVSMAIGRVVLSDGLPLRRAGRVANLCLRRGEIPLTRALLAMGVGPGPAFCFMLASVGTCLPTVAMATRIIGWRATVIYVIAWLLLAVGGGVLMGWWL